MENKIVTKEEILKWTERIKPIIPKLTINDIIHESEARAKAQTMLTNMNAYISDSKHFMKQGDYVRSFEAIVWAWAIYEICKELEVFIEE
jgi:hypothetical protein